MHQRVEINSFMVTKLKDEISFTKYDIEASIDEVESEDDHVRLKYRFVLLSNPTNVKISVDGFTSVYGNQQEITRHLSNDERNIPRVVNALYQEVFPFLYITSKTMQIPCPAYKLADITKSSHQDIVHSPEQIETKPIERENVSDIDTSEISQIDGSVMVPESLIHEQKIPTV